MRRSFRHSEYRPKGEKILKESKISVASGILAIIAYFVTIYCSYQSGGNAGRYLGFICWVILVIAANGVYFAKKSLGKPGGRMYVKMAGLTINIIVLLILCMTFIKGVI